MATCRTRAPSRTHARGRQPAAAARRTTTRSTPTRRCGRRSSARAARGASTGSRDFGARGRLGRGARALAAARSATSRCCARTTASATASTRSSTTRRCTGCCGSGVEREVNSLPWRDPRPGAHVVRDGDVLPLQPARHRARAARCRSTTRPSPTMRQDAGAGRRVGGAADAARLRPLRAGRAW